jgi:hypothetical protein
MRPRDPKAGPIAIFRFRAALALLLWGGWLPAVVETARCSDAVTFHVAPAGDDTWEGSASRPFATLERARGAVRAHMTSQTRIPAGRLVVELAPGTHRRTESFTLSSEDSGAEATPVIWRARTPGAALIDVGVRLPNSVLKLVEGADAERLAPEARGNVYLVDLRAMGLHSTGPYPANFDNGGGLCELFFNGLRQPLSRWPNDGPARIERVVDKGESAPGEPRRVGRFVAREGRVAGWPVEQGVWLEGYWRVPWDVRTVRVAAIDSRTREVTLAAPVAGGIGSKYAGPTGSGREPWWGVNIVEEIDQPGEWAVDFTKGLLFWWPPQNWQSGEVVLSDLKAPAIRMEKTSFVSIEGFRLENGLSNGVEIHDCHDVAVAGCRLRNFGGAGVVVQRGARVRVRSCDIEDMGHSGIVLGGGDRASLRSCGHTAENNHIQRVGALKKTYAPGILVGIYGSGYAVGCSVSHNFIHDVPHAGIQYGGNNHVFEYNEISRAVLSSDDMGAFYTSNDWTSCGNLLRYNFVHHSPNAVAFYMDDGDSGDTVFGNVAYEMQSGPAVCGGHYNTVENNLVVRCKRGLFMDARGIARKYDKESSLFKKLSALPFSQPPWRDAFPFLQSLPDSDTRLPAGNAIRHNVTVLCAQPTRVSAKPTEIGASVISDNLDLGDRDPLFKREAAGDLSLLPDSPIFKESPRFEPIPFTKIGLITDEFRSNLPVRQWENAPQQWAPH